MNTIHPPPSPWGLPPPAGYSVWQRSNPARGIQQTCKLLNLLKTILARTCTFLFSQLLQEQQPYSLNANRDGFLITFCPTRAVSISLPALQLYPGAHLLNTAACTRVPPQTRLWNTQWISVIYSEVEKPSCLPSLLPSSQEHSWLLIRFYAAWWTAYWVMTPFVVEKTTVENSIVSTVNFSSLIDDFIKMAVKSVSFVVKNYITIFLRTYWWRK